MSEQQNDVGTPVGRGEAEDGTLDFFVALADLAAAKDVEANGPNEPGRWRSLHAVSLTMAEINKCRIALYFEAEARRRTTPEASPNE